MSKTVDELNALLGDRYRVERLLGEGGMASVYLAEDLRHARKVALKVLKPQLAAVLGAERFLAEIRTTANLQHSHILPVFDSGEAGGLLFYVMPHVEGESLRDRLERERQLPVDEAVRIATQVAEALEHAHRQGVVHRDVKPANILLRGDDAFVSDFGIALAVGADMGRLTQTGVSLGTPQYMSPEQATGDAAVGPASDIWSLGCVLYEMLAGAPPYHGSTPQAILGKIVSGSTEPLTKERRTTPLHVEAAVACALETLPADRFASARDFALALKDSRFRHGERRARRRLWPAVTGGAVLYALGMLTWWVVGRSAQTPEASTPIAFVVPGLASVSTGRTLALSPDGVLLAYGVASVSLSVRRVGDFETPKDLGVEATQPFFSPDGAEIAYFSGIAGGLERISITGGTPTVVYPGGGARAFGGSWGDDGTIVFATGEGVFRVSAREGATPELLLRTPLAPGSPLYAWPQWLPGSSAVLLTVVPANATSDTDCWLVVLDVASGELTEVLTGGAGGRYLADGYLLYSADDGTLHAAAFDPSTYRLEGDRVALPVTGLAFSRGWAADFDVSDTGTLAYVPASQRSGALVWVDRDGREEPLSSPARGYTYPRVSPDGGRIAVDIGAQTARNISVWDIRRESFTPITNESGEEWGVEWSTRGDSLYYTSNQLGGAFQVFRRAADGSGEPELLFPHSGLQVPQDVSSDGRWLLVIESRPSPDQFDLMRLFLDDPVRVDTVLSTPGIEYNASLSRDGRFVAYQTYEAGQAEVYVRPVDDALRERAKVSVDGGEKPLWSPTGDTVFYRSPSDSMMAAPVTTAPRLRVGTVNALFAIGSDNRFGAIGGRWWDISPVDGRFLIVRRPPRETPGARVVLNWTQELRRLMEQ